MAEEGVFGKIASHVLEATEQIANRVDEGISVLWKGELPKAASNVQTDPTGDNFEEEVFIDEDMAGSPLEGIADSVLGDIMGAQVGICGTSFLCCPLQCERLLYRYSHAVHSLRILGWSTNTHGTLTSLPCGHSLDGTLYHVLNDISRHHVCDLYVGFASKYFPGGSRLGHGVSGNLGSNGRAAQLVCRRALGRLLHTKLF